MKVIEKGPYGAESIMVHRFPAAGERWMRAGREP